MELGPELVAKPTKDKPATKLVCNFQQQVCVLIRTDSWVRRLELACHAVAVPTTGANGRKMSHSQRRIRLAATLARVGEAGSPRQDPKLECPQQGGSGCDSSRQRHSLSSRNGQSRPCIITARAHDTSLPPATRLCDPRRTRWM